MRAFKPIVCVGLWLVVGFFVWGNFIEPATWRNRAKNSFVKALSSAQTTNDLQKIVKWGIFIPLTNGSWIAIRYQDSHYGGIRSLAIARDSGGAWFESDFHFCGALGGYLHHAIVEEMHQESVRLGGIPNRGLERTEFDSLLDSVHDAPSLETARENLLKLKFRPMRPPSAAVIKPP